MRSTAASVVCTPAATTFHGVCHSAAPADPQAGRLPLSQPTTAKQAIAPQDPEAKRRSDATAAKK
ncbi:hypothetical protein B0T16DRAFT_413626 [Cercophora newfieldiana]|uniref:Uncharacterized protein n=1 Tax=Cercophora newfieldiana TaxID=92897 RepID=A0AA39Y5Q0_9PEZI|nr:hypothetical protein B0T16DRAFT_413626 [Cercophora newfieldiana]